MQGQIKAINYFAKCHIKEFLKVYPNICPEFTDMFNQIKEQYAKYVKEERFTGAWGEDYKEEIMKIHNYFNDIPLFVYGTLMKGQSNHNYLSDSNYIGDGTLLGYDMYNLGCYPGIIDGTGKVYGELYDVNDYKLKDIDYLEGEGSLYIRKLVKVSLLSGEFIDAWCYIYNHTVSNYQKMSGRYGHDDMVWYISYGSNMLEERLKYYILGGTCHFNNKTYVGCKDKTLFTESKAVIIPYNMYYSNYNQGSWENSAVSFLDLTTPGRAFGRAYKIKRSQLNELHNQEGKSPNWYPNCIQLEDIDGIPAFTVAGYQLKQKEPFSRVSAEYGYVLYKGMKEAYPHLKESEIFDYLKACGK